MIERTLIDFRQADHHENWEIVNDLVMGGLSAGEFLITEDSTALFRGTVSLENYGGFASVHTLPGEYDLSGLDGMLFDVRGDGKRYRFRVRVDDALDGLAYQKSFETEENKWVTIRIPLRQLEASYRGRKVPEAPPLDPGRIRRIGFLIGDKQEGPFSLEIARIRTYSEQGDHEGPEDAKQRPPW